jgi:hypothetical protein
MDGRGWPQGRPHNVCHDTSAIFFGARASGQGMAAFAGHVKPLGTPTRMGTTCVGHHDRQATR